jgi:hypothetical protein
MVPGIARDLTAVGARATTLATAETDDEAKRAEEERLP